MILSSNLGIPAGVVSKYSDLQHTNVYVDANGDPVTAVYSWTDPATGSSGSTNMVDKVPKGTTVTTAFYDKNNKLLPEPPTVVAVPKNDPDVSANAACSPGLKKNLNTANVVQGVGVISSLVGLGLLFTQRKKLAAGLLLGGTGGFFAGRTMAKSGSDKFSACVSTEYARLTAKSK